MAPKRVSFSTKDLSSTRAYWLEIGGLEKFGFLARIDAEIDGQKINITTDNVSDYKLRLNSSLIDLDKKIRIIENGAGIFNGFLGKDGCFVRSVRSDIEPANKLF